jgi:hypothetical protein
VSSSTQLDSDADENPEEVSAVAAELCMCYECTQQQHEH